MRAMPLRRRLRSWWREKLCYLAWYYWHIAWRRYFDGWGWLHPDVAWRRGNDYALNGRPWHHLCCNGDKGGWRTDVCDWLETRWRNP